MSRSLWLSRAGLALFISTAGIGIAATPAQAAATGVASVSGTSRVIFKAASNKTNKVVVTRSGRTVTIDDAVALKPGKGCKKVDASKVRCTLESPDNVQVFLGSKNDTVVNKSDLAISVSGGSGNDRIYGGPRNDSLNGGNGNDLIYGGAGRDRLIGGMGADRLHAGAGNDQLSGGYGNDALYGDAGDDHVSGDEGNDKEYGGAGQDQFNQSRIPYSSTGADLISGGGGNDYVGYELRTKRVVADLDGVKGDDGEAGEHDTLLSDLEYLEGGNGNDVLSGRSGKDMLIGGPGNDTLRGLAGNDYLDGGPGQDRLEGGAGNDDLYPDYGSHEAYADVVLGGSGRDLVSYLAYTVPVTVDLDGASRDDGIAGEHDTVGADVEDVAGGSANDRITGNASANRIRGFDGADVIRGGAGNDFLSGDDGADQLYGDAGDDFLNTGGGLDTGADRLDGGANATGTGDDCWPQDALDTTVNCEYAKLYWPTDLLF
ncbi:calcium-binding protein [Actinoplanes awajinensis]|uniref:Calcium-binding protein n=1 Tax=Actinoplanes awajinensis subsp. mycoplanecinus TaxID=135947 RepID=A0A0X3UPU8_9ACTN|nr:calcium-binding protein [Actinoplanes awajinensis]KUL34619.1 hypothetical protein ADL15_16270 [Actinoplanes awajinensis subsp. mycoplanecinus]